MSMTDASDRSNVPEWSVSELSGVLKRTIEENFAHIRVRGEISGYRGPHGSGHVYFGLKDQGAKIDAVIWKGVFSRLRFKPEEGMEVIATGKISTFPGSSKYQVIIETLEPAGIGALMMMLEERRRKLGAEGLFDAARKQLLPYLPGVIGVVTSPTGAVIRDILHRLSDRFPRHVLVWPVRVQGETSAGEVAQAIRGFNALPEDGPIARPDVLVVARGGGSLEDLWSFNEDIVVRAAAESLIPLVSAIGHETDWTLIDLAADIRAPTPTGAAEMIVPVRADLVAGLVDLDRRRIAGMARLVERRKSDLRGLVRGLPAAGDLIAIPRQRLDLSAGKLGQALLVGLRRHETRLAGLSMRLSRQSPHARLAAAREKLSGAGKRLAAALRARLRGEAMMTQRRSEQLVATQLRLRQAVHTTQTRRHDKLQALNTLLRSVSYQGVLARGFALVRDKQSKPLRSAGAIHPGMALTLEFADGTVKASANGDGLPERKPKPAKSEGDKPPGDQGRLF
jgi:exodeoxyribonuclease VII large subunit